MDICGQCVWVVEEGGLLVYCRPTDNVPVYLYTSYGSHKSSQHRVSCGFVLKKHLFIQQSTNYGLNSVNSSSEFNLNLIGVEHSCISSSSLLFP